MPNPKNSKGPYALDFSDTVAEQLRELQRRATRQGQGKAFVSAFGHIVRALRNDPHAVGEPLYRLPALRLQIRAVVVFPLAINFAVSEDRALVYIRSGRLLSGHHS